MKLAVVILVLVVTAVVAFFGYYLWRGGKDAGEFGSRLVPVKERTLDRYTIDNLGKTYFEPSGIELGEVLKEEPEFVSRVFYFRVDPPSREASEGQAGKRVSGQVNYPKAAGTYPVIVMNRGYIEQEGFTTGDGTRRSSEEFVKAGFVTLAPDFLGYGESDMPSDFPVEERFQTYTTVLMLLESIPNLNETFLNNQVQIKVDPRKIGLWGHSNGGQITMTVLEITGKSYPAVLWAPVSKPFPYSILYYTDDFDDHGKALRKVVAQFEQDYDSELYSTANYLDKINASVSIHQGSSDEEVPINWSGDLVLELKKLNKQVEYFTYPEDDHNFANGNWQLVVSRNIEFFKNNL